MNGHWLQNVSKESKKIHWHQLSCISQQTNVCSRLMFCDQLLRVGFFFNLPMKHSSVNVSLCSLLHPLQCPRTARKVC
ncbi:uncharacterized protein MONOS_17638 [Monocercomonoides exilis]|uniref:uncharacterized protein n=1 Tax=Monocercomonoides exilis TaxID=2049356 RepID=UPI003559A47D|nr:hypothetical protein MONOS_17638 [Monocercomonoides exilis]